MAAKSENEVIAGLQDYVAAWKIMIDFLEGPMEIQLEAIEDEILTGDSNDITNFQLQSLQQFRARLANFYLSSIPFFASVSPSLSELAGNPSPGSNPSADMAWLHDYMTDNSKAVKTRGFTKSSWSADGSNVGNGRIVQHKADINTLDIDVAHPDSNLRLRCMDSGGGFNEGQEPFELIGAKVNRIWRDNGIMNGVYQPQVGLGFNDIGKDQLRSGGPGLDSQAMRSMSGGSPMNLLGTNGGFESAVSGSTDSRFAGMTIISGGDNLSVESTAPIVGDQSLKVDGNFVAYITLNERALKPKTALSFGALVEKVIGSSTLTGTLTFVLRSGGDKDTAAQGTAHKTLTVTIGSLSDDTVTPQDDTLIVPAALGADPRIEITVTSYSDGSGTDNSLLIDEVYAAPMYQVDMGQFILPVRGATSWEVDDFFTATVTNEGDEGDNGLVQEFINRIFGRYVKHASSATGFTEPTLEPEISVQVSPDGTAANLAAHTDGGQSDAGTLASGAHDYMIEFENLGIYPLAVGLPARSSETNISAVDDGMTTPIVVMPGRKHRITVEVTDGGAGAWATTLTFDTNDSSEATYEVDLIGEAS